MNLKPIVGAGVIAVLSISSAACEEKDTFAPLIGHYDRDGGPCDDLNWQLRKDNFRIYATGRAMRERRTELLYHPGRIEVTAGQVEKDGNGFVMRGKIEHIDERRQFKLIDLNLYIQPKPGGAVEFSYDGPTKPHAKIPALRRCSK
mgnify:CR=1 FL=1